MITKEQFDVFKSFYDDCDDSLHKLQISLEKMIFGEDCFDMFRNNPDTEFLFKESEKRLIAAASIGIDSEWLMNGTLFAMEHRQAKRQFERKKELDEKNKATL